MPLFAVVGFQIHFLDFRNKRIARVRAGALIVERLDRHFVETGQEGLFVDAVFLDGSSEFPFELLDCLNQILNPFSVVAPFQAEVIATLA